MKPNRIILILHGECFTNTDKRKYIFRPIYTNNSNRT